jgi:hypothetical protein
VFFEYFFLMFADLFPPSFRLQRGFKSLGLVKLEVGHLSLAPGLGKQRMDDLFVKTLTWAMVYVC